MSHSWRAKSESCLQGDVHDYMIITEKNELMVMKTAPFRGDPVKTDWALALTEEQGLLTQAPHAQKDPCVWFSALLSPS